MEQRKHLGIRIVGFLALMTWVTYKVKKHIWRRRRALIESGFWGLQSPTRSRGVTRERDHGKAPGLFYVRSSGMAVIGVIGGSGLYDIEGLANREWRRV